MYQHKIQYYETDKMGITHHSNYIRWMEEARIDFLQQLGFGFDKLEQGGIVSPVLSVECSYKKPTTFPQEIGIEVKLLEFKGAKLKIGYEMKNEAGELVCEAVSGHCFLNAKGRPIRLKNDFPEFFAALTALIPPKP